MLLVNCLMKWNYNGEMLNICKVMRCRRFHDSVVVNASHAIALSSSFGPQVSPKMTPMLLGSTMRSFVVREGPQRATPK